VVRARLVHNQEYRLGQRYLIVARRTGQMPRDSAMMSVISGNAKKAAASRLRPCSAAGHLFGSGVLGIPARGWVSAYRSRFGDAACLWLRAATAACLRVGVSGAVLWLPPKLDGPALKGAQITLTKLGVARAMSPCAPPPNCAVLRLTVTNGPLRMFPFTRKSSATSPRPLSSHHRGRK